MIQKICLKQHNSANSMTPKLVGRVENRGIMKLKTGVAIFLMFIVAKTALATEPYNYAERWHSWNVVTREAYISGAVDGIAEAFIVTMTTVAPGKFSIGPVTGAVGKAMDKLFVRYTRDQIGDVITDLYKDPANGFITTIDMFFLARDKIEGKDIAKGIMEARKKALDTHKLNEVN